MKKLLAIISIILIAFFFVFGVYNYRGKHSNFRSDGYVIDTKTNNKQYFSNNGEYKVYDSSKSVIFTNSDNETQNISNDTFIHYTDGSVSAFKKISVVALNNMEQKSFQYYTVHSGVIFSKRDKDYKIPYLDKQLTFSEFLIKISPNKYMVLSPKLKIKNGDEVKDVTSGYVELTYSDGNVVKIQNQDLDIQTIASNVLIYVDDDTYINLSNKKIYYKNVEKINLGEITIESNDNIEIIEDEENNKIDDNGKENNSSENSGENGESPSKTIHKGDFEKVSDGKIDAADIEMEAVVEENSKIKDPVVTINEFEVSANTLSIQLRVTDEANAMIANGTTCKVIKASTGEVVFSDACSDRIEVLNLQPETNYIFVFNGEYVKNEIHYNKDFVQRTFVTRSLGIYAIKDYVKTNAVGLIVAKKDFSKVRSFKYDVVDNTSKQNVVLGENDVYFSDESDSYTINLTELDSNHNYTLVLRDYVYDTERIENASSYYYYNFNTLKAVPTVDNTSFVIDQKNNKFIVQLNNMQDLDSGIVEYRADVYEAGGNKFVITKSTEVDNKIEFSIDGQIIKRDLSGGYNVYVYLVFNNNEIEYEIPIGFKNVQIGGKQGPIATLNLTDVTWSSMKGSITITDTYRAIVEGTKIEAVIKSMTYANEIDRLLIDYSFNDENKMTFNFEEYGLKKNSSYEISLRTKVDYDDDNGEMMSDFASFIVNTPAPNTFEAIVGDVDASGNLFKVSVDFNESSSTDLEARAMNGIIFMIYSDEYDPNTDLDNCTHTNRCWYTGLYDSENTRYDSELYSTVYENNNLTFTNASFGLTEMDYDEYHFKIFGAYDYTEHRNDLPIRMLDNDNNVVDSVTFLINSTNSIVNTMSPMNITNIYKSDLANNTAECPSSWNSKDDTEFLNDDTIVGFRVKANLSNVNAINTINNATFKIYNSTDENTVLDSGEVSVDQSTEELTYTFCLSSMDGVLKRGKSYKFNYVLDLKNDETDYESTISRAYDAEKQEAKIKIYQKNMGLVNNQYNTTDFYYIYEDVDDAVVGNKLYYYVNNDNNDVNNNFVTLNKTSNGDLLSIPFTNNNGGTLHAYVDSVSLLRTKKIEYINYTFSGMKSDLSNIGYEFIVNDSLNNKCELVFNNISSTDAKRIVGVEFTLTNVVTNNEVTMYKQLNSDNKIVIQYSDIISLKSPDSEHLENVVVSNMKLFYDNGIYSMVTNTDEPFAIQRRDGNKSYIVTGNMFIYNQPNIDISSSTFDLYVWNGAWHGISSDNALATKEFRLNNGYIILGNEYVSFKKILYIEPDCVSGGTCEFAFSSIKPTIDLTSELAYVTTAKIRGFLSGVDGNSEDFKAKIFECSNNDCTDFNPSVSQPKSIVTSTLSDFNSSGINFSGLTPGQKYRIYYYWKDEEIIYYVGNRPKYTEFVTTEDVGITNIEVNYLSGASNDDRRLSINYSIGILEGYAGINYKIIRRDNNEVITELGDISDTLNSIGSGIYGGVYSKIINITGKLQSSVVYYLEITPYYNDGVNDVNLRTERKRFSFTITEPVISIMKSSDESNSIFDVEIIMTDVSNSMLGGGGQDGQQSYDFKIYKKNELDEYEYITDGNIGELTTINNISCINGSCDFKIEYYVNIGNTSTYKSLASYEYQIECAEENDIVTGNPTIAPTDNPGKIRIAFPDSFGITNVDRIGYTIYNSSLDVVDNNDNYTPVIWSTISENNSIPYMEIPINFNTGNDNYRVQLQLYYEDELVGSFSLDYIKG